MILIFRPTHPTMKIMINFKAEALYNMGEFERALVQYERGTRVRKVINS